LLAPSAATAKAAAETAAETAAATHRELSVLHFPDIALIVQHI
jgi:hypothetical protein